jgi:branched-chain amino acid transport system permease protein
MENVLAQAIINGIAVGSIYAIIAVGLNIIFGVMKIVNFAHGEFLMIAMYIIFWMYYYLGIDPLLASPISLVISLLLGYITYKIVINRIITKEDYVQIATTMGLSLLLIGLAQLLWSPVYRGITTPYATFGIEIIKGVYMSLPHLAALLYTLGVSVFLYYFLKFTKIGLILRATAQDVIGAELCGTNTEKIYLLAWILGIGITGASAGILAGIYYTHPYIGQTLVLYAFIVAVIGGLGNYIGGLIGAFILGMALSISTIYISSDLSLALAFLVFILVLLIRPSGLMGVKVVKRA